MAGTETCFPLPFSDLCVLLCFHSPRPANCTLFCQEVLFMFRSLITDPMTILCKRRIEDFHRAQIVKFASFTGAFTGKYVVKSVKDACKTVHSTPKETCQHATQFDRPCKTACFPPKNGLIALQTPRTSGLSTFYYCQVVNRALLRLLSTYILV